MLELDEENQSNSPPSIPRIIRRACVPNVKTEVFTTSKVKTNNTTISKKTKLNSKPSPDLLPRPRAVLSSPENDGMIGDINKLFDNERCTSNSSSKMLGAERKTPTKTAAMPRPNKAKTPLNAARKARGYNETAANRSNRGNLKQSKLSKLESKS